MQFFADDHGQIIAADEGIKGRDYLCPTCKKILRVKEGPCRRKHFFHKNSSPCASSRSKSARHVNVQRHLINALPQGEAFPEKRFPSIRRIADIAWPAQRLIFEVQCSFLPLDEVKKRNRDYASLGYQVIWILHDHRFNRRLLSAAEVFLHSQIFYFTNIDAQGKGIIYDQLDLLAAHVRLKKGPRLRVDISAPLPKPQLNTATFPPDLKKKTLCASLCFRGDVLNRLACQSIDLTKMTQLPPSQKSLFLLWRRHSQNYLSLALRYLLRKASLKSTRH